MTKKATPEPAEEVIVFESDKQKKQQVKLEKKRIKKEQKEIRKEQEAEFKSKNKFTSTVKNKIWPVLIPFVIVMIFLIILPLISIIIVSLQNPTGDSTIIAKATIKNYVRLVKDQSIWAAIGLSIGFACLASLLSVVLGYPIAYIMSVTKSKLLSQNMWVLVTMPMWIMMLLKVLGLNSFLYLCNAAGFIGTPIAIIVGMIYMFLPFAIGPMYDSIIGRQTDLEEAARDLGCSSWKTFWTITLRQTMPGVLTGFSLVIVQASTSLIAAKYLVNGKATLVADVIEKYFLRGGDWGYASAISVVLTLLVFLVMWIINVISKKFENKGKEKSRWRNSSKVRISQ